MTRTNDRHDVLPGGGYLCFHAQPAREFHEENVKRASEYWKAIRHDSDLTIEEALDASPAGISRVNYANAVWTFATVGQALSALFVAMAEVTRSRLKHCHSQHLAKTGPASPVTSDTTAEVATSSWETFYFADLANTVWAIATLWAINQIAHVVTNRSKYFKSQRPANTVWAFAAIGQASSAFFNAIAGVAARYWDAFYHRDLANTVWAFATLWAIHTIADEATNRSKHSTPQRLANTVWAYAAIGRASFVLFDAIAEVATSFCEAFYRRVLVNTVWAIATLWATCTIADVATNRSKYLNSQRLAHTVWAFATIGQASFGLFDAIAKVATSHCEDFVSRILANTVWAFATQGQVAMAPYGKLSERDFSSQSLANTAWAIAHQV